MDPVSFTLLHGNESQRFSLRPGEDDCVTIGRDPNCDLPVNLSGVSRNHAELRLCERRGEYRVAIVDLSSNATGLKAPDGSVIHLEPNVATEVPEGTLVVLPMKIKASGQDATDLRMAFAIEMEPKKVKEVRLKVSATATATESGSLAALLRNHEDLELKEKHLKAREEKERQKQLEKEKEREKERERLREMQKEWELEREEEKEKENVKQRKSDSEGGNRGNREKKDRQRDRRDRGRDDRRDRRGDRDRDRRDGRQDGRRDERRDDRRDERRDDRRDDRRDRDRDRDDRYDRRKERERGGSRRRSPSSRRNVRRRSTPPKRPTRRPSPRRVERSRSRSRRERRDPRDAPRRRSPRSPSPENRGRRKASSSSRSERKKVGTGRNFTSGPESTVSTVSQDLLRELSIGAGPSGPSGLPVPVAPGPRPGFEMCADFKRGACHRGDRCKFSHGREAVGEICADFKRGACFREHCKFAHEGGTSLGPSLPSLSALSALPSLSARLGLGLEMCADFKRGACQRERCKFSHGDAPRLSEVQPLSLPSAQSPSLDVSEAAAKAAAALMAKETPHIPQPREVKSIEVGSDVQFLHNGSWTIGTALAYSADGEKIMVLTDSEQLEVPVASVRRPGAANSMRSPLVGGPVLGVAGSPAVTVPSPFGGAPIKIPVPAPFGRPLLPASMAPPPTFSKATAGSPPSSLQSL